MVKTLPIRQSTVTQSDRYPETLVFYIGALTSYVNRSTLLQEHNFG